MSLVHILFLDLNIHQVVTYIYTRGGCGCGGCRLINPAVLSDEGHDISNQRSLDCILKSLFRLTQKQMKQESSGLTALCEGNPPVTGRFLHKGSVMWKTFPVLTSYMCTPFAHQVLSHIDIWWGTHYTSWQAWEAWEGMPHNWQNSHVLKDDLLRGRQKANLSSEVQNMAWELYNLYQL